MSLLVAVGISLLTRGYDAGDIHDVLRQYENRQSAVLRAKYPLGYKLFAADETTVKLLGSFHRPKAVAVELLGDLCE